MLAAENGLRCILYLRMVLFRSFTMCVVCVHAHMGGGECAPLCKGQSSTSGAVLKHRAPCLGDRVFLGDLGLQISLGLLARKPQESVG